MPVIGYLTPQPLDTFSAIVTAAFLEGVKEGGYVEGRNVTIEYRRADNRDDQLPVLAADLVRRQVKVIFASGKTPFSPQNRPRRTSSIVFQSGSDPIKAGFVARLN